MFQVDSVFNRDRFLLRQKLMTLSEKYDVCDDHGAPILFIERPTHWARSLLAVLAGLVTTIVMIVLLAFLLSVVPKDLQWPVFLMGTIVICIAVLAVIVLISPKRHVTIYRDASKQEPLIKIIQEKKFEWFTATFTVRDLKGDLARFRKNYLYDLFRKRWHCYRPDGSLLCIAYEDSIALALLRRLLGPMFGLLRTNFIICEANRERQIGEFNRKFTLLDRYVLDMSADLNRYLDRRIAIALGVILDTGEAR
ncbi:hypothetical protein [Limnothrix redekei]|uniref:DUF3137 domain-containing protein n=1 Tax=Limnothrix redekei LRLZ20PSL1 TaxID=3112953 RepID=A0ABW7CEM6_9CYAN